MKEVKLSYIVKKDAGYQGKEDNTDYIHKQIMERLEFNKMAIIKGNEVIAWVTFFKTRGEE